ncbi:putative acyl-CoA dehydrogenase [Actinokineospora sp. UTMC 2448]|nr:putative acyl-CoA dehydrogenase [Actinokineospora sp. UTMC 2448]
MNSAHAAPLWRELGESGELRRLYTGDVDKRFGLDTAALSRLLTTLDERHPLAVVLSVCVQVATALPIVMNSSSRAAAGVARAALDGRSTVALAVTDAELPGSDLTALATTAKIGPDSVTVTGAKDWIVNATVADHAVVLARHRPGPHPTSFVLVLVPMRSRGVAVTAQRSAMYLPAAVGRIRFDDVVVDRDHLLVPPGRGMVEFSRRMATERLAGAFWSTALLRRQLALVRRQLGANGVWRHSAVRIRFAEALMHFRQLAALCDRLCRARERAESTDAEAALVKAAAGLAVDRVLGICADLAGRDGFLDEGIQQVRAQAAMFGTAGGATHTMLGLVASGADRLLEDALWAS